MDLNLMKEQTLQQILEETRQTTLETSRIAKAQQARVDLAYRAKVQAAETAAAVDGLFVSWWQSQWMEGISTKNEMLERWFGVVLDDEKVHGVKMPLFATSPSMEGILTDDSVGLVCEPSTDTLEGRDDFAKLPQFWCLEVSAEKNADGSHEIFAVEHIDPIEQVRDGTHLCWVLQKNTYTKAWRDEQYHYLQMQCHPAAGFATWPQGTDRTGKVYSYIANPKYGAGIKDGVITCGTGLMPTTFLSHSTGVQKWRERGEQYAGASGCLLKWLVSMFWLKYAHKGNSGIIEGCNRNSYDLFAAISETNVTRFLLTPEEGQKLVAGRACNMKLGNTYSTEKILSVDEVTVEGVQYAAVTFDKAPFDTVAGESNIWGAPFISGDTDAVLGYDGSCGSNTDGMRPGRIQKVEILNGGYLIIADELWKWGKDANGDFTFDVYTCHDQTKISRDSITGDYEKQTDLTLTFPAGTEDGWWYTEDIALSNDRGVLWPIPSQAAGSTTGCGDGFYVATAEDAIRAAWSCLSYYNYSYAGLCGRDSGSSLGHGYGNACVGSPGLSG